MPSWLLLCSIVECVSLPLVGTAALGMSKCTTGPAARMAERWFLGVLLAVTLITCRTVITVGDCWLSHTATLGWMVIGALLFPNREALDERRFAQHWR